MSPTLEWKTFRRRCRIVRLYAENPAADVRSLGAIWNRRGRGRQ